MTQRHIKLVAIQFSQLLRQVLTPAEMEVINTRNLDNEMHHTCASLIYAPTEAVFKDAFYKVTHKDFDWLNPEHEEVKKEAWKFARITNFAPFDGNEAYEKLDAIIAPSLLYSDYNYPFDEATKMIKAIEENYKFKP